MKALVLIVVLAISSTRSHYHHGYGSSEDDEISPPWWHPRTPGGDKPSTGPKHFDSFGSSDSDEDQFSPPSDRGRWNFDGPWTRYTTEKPRVTFPIYPPTSSSTTTPRDSGSSSAKPGLNLVIESCKNACPVTAEHNPVCGTDNVTYGNIGLLECARMCGVDVQLKRKSRCSTTNNGGAGGNTNGGTGGNTNGGTGGNTNGGTGGNTNGGTGGNTNGGNGGNNNGRDNNLIQACIRNCPVTSEYNPVCGTDNVTYTNPGRLECVQRCGLVVNISRRSSCSAPISRDEGIQICITSCSVTSEYNPVCGTDNRTYANEGRLECAKNCGRNVEISRRTSCSMPIDPWTPTTTSPNGNGNCNGNTNGNCNGNNPNPWGSTPSPNGSGNGSNGGGSGSKIPSVTEIIACMQLCHNSPEVNPVCGTDGVTYSSAGQLLCAQSCGVDVKVRMFAPCLGSQMTRPPPTVCPTLPTPTSTQSPTKGPNSIQDCVNKCLVSLELKPVCGTDGVTYINIESLRCKMNCGVAVSVLKMSACGSSTPPPTAGTPPVWINTDRTTEPTAPTGAPHTSKPNQQACLNKCSNTEQVYKPVCGTDGITYANLAALQCAQRCGKNVEMQSQSTCVSGSKDEATTDNGLGFTIPGHLLSSIFPDYKPETTTPINDSVEGSYDLDERFGTPSSPVV